MGQAENTTTMQLVEKHVVNSSHKYWSECEQLCSNSNMIRNQGLYIQRQSWFYGHGVIKFGKTELHKNIDALMKQTTCYPPGSPLRRDRN
ncbi:MAG: hypothetical protein WBA41_28910 [Rivularia sp. (in: cyanobacteria)]